MSVIRKISEVKSLPFYQLIGAPILALVQGQSQASQATAEFIERIGFTRTENTVEGDLGDLRMVSFKYDRRDESGQLKSHTIQLPLLSIIPIPALEIKDVNFEYNVKVNDVQSNKSTTILKDDQSGEENWLSQNRIEFMTTMGRLEQSESKQSTDIQMKIKMNIEQADMTVGMSQLFKLLDESVNQKETDLESESD